MLCTNNIMQKVGSIKNKFSLNSIFILYPIENDEYTTVYTKVAYVVINQNFGCHDDNQSEATS